MKKNKLLYKLNWKLYKLKNSPLKKRIRNLKLITLSKRNYMKVKLLLKLKYWLLKTSLPKPLILPMKSLPTPKLNSLILKLKEKFS